MRLRFRNAAPLLGISFETGREAARPAGGLSKHRCGGGKVSFFALVPTSFAHSKFPTTCLYCLLDIADSWLDC